MSALTQPLSQWNGTREIHHGRPFVIPPHRTCSHTSDPSDAVRYAAPSPIEVPMWSPEPWAPVRQLARWHVTTQIGARRNALLAYTELAQRRREQDDVFEFLNRLNPPEEGSPGGSTRRTP